MLPFKKILVPIDYSLGARRALAAAVALRARSEGELLAFHAVTFFPGYDFSAFPTLESKVVNEELKKIAQETNPFFGEARTLVRLGAPSDAIVQCAHEELVDLIVMGTHGRTGARRVLLGSVASEVVRRAPCDVLTVHEAHGPGEKPEPQPASPEDSLPLSTILAPIDFSAESRQGLKLAISMALETGATLHVLHVINEHDGDALDPLLGDAVPNVRNLMHTARDRAEAALAKELDLVAGEGDRPKTDIHVALGHPASEIDSFATGYGVDLMVMGSLGRSGLRDLLLGSTAERVIRQAPCPVLTVRVAHRAAPAEE